MKHYFLTIDLKLDLGEVLVNNNFKKNKINYKLINSEKNILAETSTEDNQDVSYVKEIFMNPPKEEKMIFSDDDSALLWFMLKYGE